MYATDPIADMLTRIRNASSAGLKYTTIPASIIKIEITKILETEGLIRGFRLIKDNGQGKIKIAMKYSEVGQPVIRGITRVSKPGCRVYKGVEDLPKIRGGLGFAILTTPKGVLTSKTARKERVGGEVLAYIW
ncbi:30S ribosomal protein S8 [Silvanigrella paludirubra]|jgi:small subunit ribosomal protein S8|uniref:Small ribosomal subunit protein uS8 n=1 Tax=Silvanigrella paludirubra TaxID=2499159 RepID=A0A6N6VVV6_9BACT|nr:30S ribosomal protein S8 [Silvanigrella paludirubra]KAB8037597.1 30S ribosomal protein S8 [Silvanigrella paludirubra]